ncbi:MAG: DNA-3-methyladenine glycosylase 2 family protein [Alphaproteobacteria bacterium]|nr:DNA-3-methyladenine glycosylase 2 family protein [Alphaproteobacteria bacterium]MDA8006473.1 DNA-3-methyladenine glycosylase 2 family protein [Alphaproteobacteria bacterium]MDA8013905.1 DNA-3-methyladenine glycosylase 2 family protein [Alphaproteobacteria bacterium]
MTMKEIHKLDKHTLPLALRRLARRDPALRAALRAAGPPPLRFTKPGFSTLVNIVLGQQISRAAARTLRARLDAATAPRLTPESFLALTPRQLMEAGLSRQKREYLAGLAESVLDGRLPLRRLARMSDEDAIAALTAVRGFGRWSAENYLIFALARPDVMPAADLGLWIGLQRVDGLSRRPDEKILRRRAEDWVPYRSAAALLIWHCRDSLADGDSIRG